MSDAHPIKHLCAVFAVSRSGYYAWTRSTGAPRARRDRELRRKIALVHRQSRETYGSPRITVELRASGERVGRHRVARLMREGRRKGSGRYLLSAELRNLYSSDRWHPGRVANV